VRVLWVKADKLLPVQNGGNLLSYHLLRQIAARHELAFFSYYDGPADAEYESELKRCFPGSECLCTGKSKWARSDRAVDYLLRLPSAAPYAVGRFASSRVQAKISSWFQQSSFEVAVCDFLDAAINFPAKLTIPSVLFQHNVESEIWRRHALSERSRVMRLVYQLEFAKMLGYEQKTVSKFHHVIAVSEHDRRLMSAWIDPSRISVVPTGVDLSACRIPAVPASAPLVVFVGAMDWEPNIDAVEHFCSRIWPSIQAAVPAARFRIVGRNPDARVLKLVSGSVEVTGSVPSVADHLKQAAVVIVPLRVGGGTRLKIYEAMAMGKAVVSTSVGAEGLDTHPGRDIAIADDPGNFASAVAKLLLDSELRHSYELAAAALAAQYDWSIVGKRFIQVLECVAGLRCAEEPVYAQVAAGEKEGLQ